MVGRAASVDDPRCRLELDPVTGPVQTEGEIDVLEIGAEAFGKAANMEQGCPPVERAGCAGAEDRTGLEIIARDPLAVPALAGDTAEIVTIAGAVDAISM